MIEGRGSISPNVERILNPTKRLLDGCEYVKAIDTDISKTFEKYGFIPPSKQRSNQWTTKNPNCSKPTLRSEKK